MRDRKKCIIALLKEFEDEVLLKWWNEYCNNENMDDYIYENDEYFFDEAFATKYEAVRAVCYGNYNYTDAYVVFNGYGNLDSFSSYEIQNHVNYDSLAEYLMENGCYELTDVWNEDIEADFIEYANSKFEDEPFTEEDIPYGTNLVIEDWDSVIEEMLEDKKENND